MSHAFAVLVRIHKDFAKAVKALQGMKLLPKDLQIGGDSYKNIVKGNIGGDSD